MVVDFLRSCHIGQFRFFANRPDILTTGRFYFAADDAPHYPGLHNFFASVWTADQYSRPLNPLLGEQFDGPKIYSKGALWVPLPPAVHLGSPQCIQFGEVYPLAPIDRTMPGGIDSRCYEAGGEPVPVQPPGGMLCWFKPETLPDLDDGEPLAKWTDSSGFNRHISQPAAARQPTLLRAAPNWDKAVRLFTSGATPHTLLFTPLRAEDDPTHDLGTEYTCYFVATTRGSLSLVCGPAWTGPQFLTGGVLGCLAEQVSTSTDLDTVTYAFDRMDQDGFIWSVRRSGGVVVLEVNSRPINTASIDPAGVAKIEGLAAYPIPGAASRRETWLYEAMVYPYRLGEGDHRHVMDYLVEKYQIF